eukprot:scaffold128675_cov57-Phaeocystis_antarctica.AAC.1
MGCVGEGGAGAHRLAAWRGGSQGYGVERLGRGERQGGVIPVHASPRCASAVQAAPSPPPHRSASPRASRAQSRGPAYTCMVSAE